MPNSYRVVQWTTGNVGKSSVEAIADFMTLGHIMTAMPTINATPAVVAAAPGIATYNDLPLTLPHGLVSPASRPAV